MLRSKFGSARLRSSLVGTRGLATNGGSLIANVVVSGLGGFLFWIITARSAPPAAVAEASAMVSSILGVMMLSQQVLIANVPPLIAASPRPRRLVGRAYGASTALTAVVAVAFITIGPRVADGLKYLHEINLAVIFLVGCLIWSVFSLQDSVLSGLRKGQYVLAENMAWGIARLGLIAVIPAVGLALDVKWIVATWLVPALVMVGVVSYYLFSWHGSPLHTPLGSHRFERGHLLRHLGFEQVTAISNGLATLAMPAIALTALGADTAAPFLAAYSFIIVCEGAMGAFGTAFAVEVRRAGHVSGNLIRVTCVFLATFAIVAIVSAQLFSQSFMGLFGSEYRVDGGHALALLVFGLPARSISMLSNATNRLYGAGARNLTQQLGYSITLFTGLLLVDIDSGTTIAACLVAARFVAAGMGVIHLRHFLRHGDLHQPPTTAVDESVDPGTALA